MMRRSAIHADIEETPVAVVTARIQMSQPMRESGDMAIVVSQASDGGAIQIWRQ